MHTKDDFEEVPSPQHGFMLSPNPVRDQLRVFFDAPSPAVEVQVFRLTGERVLTVVKDQGVSDLHLPVADLPNGIYLLRVGRETQKFIKL